MDRAFFYALVSLAQTQGDAPMYALLILDVQVGLVHGPEKPWRCEELLETVNTLMDKARSAGARDFSRAPHRARWISNRTRQPVDDGCAGAEATGYRGGI